MNPLIYNAFESFAAITISCAFNVWNENNVSSAMSEIFWFIFLEFVDFF